MIPQKHKNTIRKVTFLQHCSCDIENSLKTQEKKGFAVVSPCLPWYIDEHRLKKSVR